MYMHDPMPAAGARIRIDASLLFAARIAHGVQIQCAYGLTQDPNGATCPCAIKGTADGHTFFLHVKQRLVFFWTGCSSAAPAAATAGLALAETSCMASSAGAGGASATGDALRCAGAALPNGASTPAEAVGELGCGWGAMAGSAAAVLGARLSLRDFPAAALFCFAA